MIDREHAQKISADRTGRTTAQGWARWTAYVMCGWSLIFAALHFYGGAGGTLFTSDSQRIQADLFAWLLSAGILCVVGMVTALALIQSRKQCLPHWLMQTSSISGGAVIFIYVVYSFLATNSTHWALAPGILCIVGAVVALALIQPWGQNIPRWLMLLFVWPGGVVLTLHALYGFVVHGLVAGGVLTWTQVQQWAGAPVTPMSAEAIRQMITQSMLIWNPWFLVGGILFVAIAWYASHHNTGRALE